MGGIMLERSSIVKSVYKPLTFNDLLHPYPRRRSIKEKIRRGAKAVTVCVAAICNAGTTIFGASDEMITSGDIQFEPPQQKIWKVNDSIAIMVAGDVGLHADLWAILMFSMKPTLEKNPQHQWRVRDIAKFYLDAVTTTHAEHAERDLLSPLGLTLSSFFSQQKEMLPDFARQLADRIQRYPMLDASAIVVGTDSTGCHIYVVEDGELTCKDAIGFAAVGAGFWHANSHFMFAKHTRFEPGHRSALRTYAAKKRAEVAPGVGKKTDMFSIGTQAGSYSPLPPDFINHLQILYESYTAAIDSATSAADQQIEDFTNQLIAAEQAAKAAQAAPPAVNPAPPQEDIQLLEPPKTKPPKKRGKN
jgi:hypothetical protein